MSSFQYMNRCIQIWVDGSYSPNSYRGGIGLWFNDNHPMNASITLSSQGIDSNDVELWAVQKAVDVAPELQGSRIIYTDSQFVLQNLQKLKSGGRSVTVKHLNRNDCNMKEAHKLAQKAAGI